MALIHIDQRVAGTEKMFANCEKSLGLELGTLIIRIQELLAEDRKCFSWGKASGGPIHDSQDLQLCIESGGHGRASGCQFQPSLISLN